MTDAAEAHGTATGGATAVADEVARFSALADAWWDPEGEFRPLHRLNPVRIAYIRDRLVEHFGRDPAAAAPLAGLSLVDVGCGGGLVAEPLARLGASVTAIDASHRSIGIAAAHARAAGLDIAYRCAGPETLVAEGRRFDVVVSVEVVEHVADVDEFLAACAGLLRPGGVLVMATINRTLKSLALAKIGAEYVLRWVPAGTHEWRRFVRPSELAAGFRRVGLDVVDLAGMSYDPLTDRWATGGDLDVNYIACFVDA